MTPIRALTTALVVDSPALDDPDELLARDVALSVLGSLQRIRRWSRDSVREAKGELGAGRRLAGLDVGAALQGGVRGDDGDVLRVG